MQISVSMNGAWLTEPRDIPRNARKKKQRLVIVYKASFYFVFILLISKHFAEKIIKNKVFKVFHQLLPFELEWIKKLHLIKSWIFLNVRSNSERNKEIYWKALKIIRFWV